jgi:hypothetical protein
MYCRSMSSSDMSSGGLSPAAAAGSPAWPAPDGHSPAGGLGCAGHGRMGLVWPACAPSDPTRADRPDGDGVDSTSRADRSRGIRAVCLGSARSIPLHRRVVRAVPRQPWRRRRQDQLDGVRHALVPQHHARPRDGDRRMDRPRDCPRHPQWRDSGRSEPPLAGHDLGPRLELGRRGRARPDCLCASHAACPTGAPASASARARRLHHLHVLGSPQHRGRVSVTRAGDRLVLVTLRVTGEDGNALPLPCQKTGPTEL